MFIIVLSDDKNFYKTNQFSFDDSQHTEIIFYNIGSSYRLEAKSEKNVTYVAFVTSISIVLFV